MVPFDSGAQQDDIRAPEFDFGTSFYLLNSKYDKEFKEIHDLAWIGEAVKNVNVESSSSEDAEDVPQDKKKNSEDVAGSETELERPHLYIQMEACAQTLYSYLDGNKDRNEEWGWRCFRQIVEGLAHIHGKGVLHLDLTSHNIFLDADDNVKIADFGLAQFSTADVTEISDHGQGGIPIYVAPEIAEQRREINENRTINKKVLINEKADIYSLGVIFLELMLKIGSTKSERYLVLGNLAKGILPTSWDDSVSEKATLLRKLTSLDPSCRPFAKEILKESKPENLDDVLDALNNAQVYTEVVRKVFSLERSTKPLHQHGIPKDLERDESLQLETDAREQVIEVTKDCFKKNGARRLDIASLDFMKNLEIEALSLQDDPLDLRNVVKLLNAHGDMFQLPHELRLPFAQWVVRTKKDSYRRYEISDVYRQKIGHSRPNRYLEGDFDVVGEEKIGTVVLTIEVAMDIIAHFLPRDTLRIHLNHYELVDTFLCKAEMKQTLMTSLAESFSMMGVTCPQSLEREARWQSIKERLIQDCAGKLVEDLQQAHLCYCGQPQAAIPALHASFIDVPHLKRAVEELDALSKRLGDSKFAKKLFVDSLIAPTKLYYTGPFFQIFSNDVLVACGGSYDRLLHILHVDAEYIPPSACGVTIALEYLVQSCLIKKEG